MNTQTQSAPISLGLLKTAFLSQEVPKLAAGQSTHEPALKFVNQLLLYTQDEDRIVAIVKSALPENYTGDTLREIPEMVKSGIAKGLHNRGNEAENSKNDTIANAAISLIREDIVELFHDRNSEAYAMVRNGVDHTTLPIRSSIFKSWICRKFYIAVGKPLPSKSQDEVFEVLAAEALFDGPAEDVHLRIAGIGDRVFVDLANDAGEVVEIGPQGWKIISNQSVKFRRATGMRPLPIPVQGGDLRKLQTLLGLSGKNWVLVLAFIINALKPGGPYMCLLISAEQGADKSVLCSILKRIIDPSEANKLRLPKNEHDLMIQAKEYALIVFDNVSGVKWDISDALCSLATGSGFATRKYYTDSEMRVFAYSRPFVINGIGSFASRPDLLERAIPLTLDPMPTQTRRSEAAIYAEFDAILPEVLGCLYNIVAHALQHQHKIAPPTAVRMADAAAWLVAAEGAAGIPNGTFIEALTTSQRELMLDNVIDDPITAALLKVAGKEPFEGTMKILHEKMLTFGDARHLPPTPQHLSNALERLRPSLEKAGIKIERGERRRSGRLVSVTVDPNLEVGSESDEGAPEF